jgi:hypothetical protein
MPANQQEADMRTKTALLASILCLGTSAALADALPNITPDHDFTGIYLMTKPDGDAKTITVSYSAAVRAARIDVPDSPGYVLIDLATHDFKMVMPPEQKYMDMAALAAQGRLLMGANRGAAAPDPNAPPSAPPEIEDLGTATYAGHTCDLMKITDPSNGDWTEICTTHGGIILHIHTDKGDDVTAQKISDTAVAPADVEIPPGYTPFVMPGMPGGMQLPGGMQMPNGMQMPPGMTMPGGPPAQ